MTPPWLRALRGRGEVTSLSCFLRHLGGAGERSGMRGSAHVRPGGAQLVTDGSWARGCGSHLAGVEPGLCRSHNPGRRGYLTVGCSSARSCTSPGRPRAHYWCGRFGEGRRRSPGDARLVVQIVPSISELEGTRHSSNAWRSGRLRDVVDDTAPLLNPAARSRLPQLDQLGRQWYRRLSAEFTR